MSRPWDWSPLDLASDPVPGDPTDIRSSAVAARATSTLIETQSRRLRRLAKAEGWDSESGRTFTTSAEPLADAIDKAKQRYLDLATALDTYADGLEELQRQADAARLDADEAKEARRTADKFVVPGETDPFEIDRQEAARTRAVDLADTDLADAKAVITRLVGTGGDTDGEYGALNDRAIAAIRLAGDDELRDTWWDGVKQVVHDARGVLGAIKDVLNALGPLLAAVGLAVALLGGPIGWIIIAGIAVAAASLAITSAQAMAGDATQEDVIADLIGLGMAIVGLQSLNAMKFAVAGATRSIASSAASRAGAARAASVPARKAESARKAAEESAESAVFRSANAAARHPGVITADSLLTGGWAELWSVLRLGRGGPAASEMRARGITWALAGGAANASDLVGATREVLTLLPDIRDGSYWTTKHSHVQVGSL
ncbi:hypothetical protein [Frigoribacterium sp. R86507]|uniref:hypothetical protein n=1 Tax=Frigoribacterium sp. R86507 TaxID=3093850 RepID=UPI0037C93BCE